MKPLYIWAGGKNKMLKKYADYLPKSFSTYVEPFFGGGAMYCWAYRKNPDARFVINDINESIINIYTSIKYDLSNFINKMDELSNEYLPLDKPSRKEYYFNLRHQHAFDYEAWDKTIESATLYFLMKTGFNGIWQINKNTNGRFGTPSGLLNQKDKVYDKENVLEWHAALQKTTILSGDFSETLEHSTEGSYTFLDPPYRGSFTQYGIDFDDKIQMSVLDHLNKCKEQGSYTLLSNRDVGDGFFEDNVGDNKMAYFNVTYTAGRRKKNNDGSFSAKPAKEVLIF